MSVLRGKVATTGAFTHVVKKSDSGDATQNNFDLGTASLQGVFSICYCATKPRNPRHFDRFEGGRKSVSDTFLTKTVFGAFRGEEPWFHALFGVKTLSGDTFEHAFNETGLRG